MHRFSEIFTLFAKLGAVAFGGPAAHIALFETEIVERRRWIDRGHFLDLIGATHLIPGPNSTEMALHLGWERGRWLGLLAAGVGFIGPAMLTTLVCAWLYVELGTLPAVDAVLAGIQPVVVAIIFMALWRLGNKALSDALRWTIAVGVAAAALLGAAEIPALLIGTLVGTVLLRLRRSLREPKEPGGGSAATLLLAPAAVGAPVAASASGVAVGLVPLGIFFLKVGAILYGSGYVLIAFLEGGLVDRYGWLTSAQLLDAVAIGQLTPGPVLTTATFVGYLVAGVPGALVATLAIFLPSFVFVVLLNPIVPRLRRGAWSAAFLDAVNAAAVALMAAVTLELATEAVASSPRLLLFTAAVAMLLKTKVHAAWLVLAGALVGLLLGPALG
ncbi:MAG: chromate efflux transporter [Acidobacteriota bacterium]